jgi:hypothetical protein
MSQMGQNPTFGAFRELRLQPVEDAAENFPTS